MSEQNGLNREAEIFDRHVDEWRRTHLGKFVLIKGADIIGFFASLDAAFRAGTEQFGLEPFFVKQIVPADAVNVTMYGKRILAAS